MTEILIALVMFAVFAAAWALLFKAGALDWLIDARMQTARTMLGQSQFAFGGEVRGVAAAAVAVRARAKPAARASAAAPATSTARPSRAGGWLPAAPAHA